MRKSFKYGAHQFLAGGTVFIIEDEDDHQVAGLRCPDEHVAHVAHVCADVEELQPVFDTVVLDEKTDFIGRGLLQVAFPDVQDFVEEFAHVESDAHPFLRRHLFRILILQEPAARGEGKLQLVAVELRFFRGNGRPDLRHVQVAEADQLVFDLPAFRLQLHLVGNRLPAASAADTEVLAEGLQPPGRRLDHFFDETFHVVALLALDTDVHAVAGYSERHEHDHPVVMCDGFAFGSTVFNDHVLEEQVDFLSGHFSELIFGWGSGFLQIT